MNRWPDTFKRYAEKMKFDALRAAVATIIFLSTWIQPVSGQGVQEPDNQFSYANLVNQFYGHDQSLINGILYYNRYPGTKGVPYLMSDDFVDGELTIQGRIYPDVKIRYDILSQYVELAYVNMQGSGNWLFTVADHVEAFQVGEYQFLKLNLDGQSGKFYQVIRTGLFTCYIHWGKRLLPIQNDHIFTKAFSDIDATNRLEMDGEINTFKNRKTFLELFPVDLQREIKRLLRKNRIKIRHASPDEMVRNMNLVADLLKNGGLP